MNCVRFSRTNSGRSSAKDTCESTGPLRFHAARTRCRVALVPNRDAPPRLTPSTVVSRDTALGGQN